MQTQPRAPQGAFHTIRLALAIFALALSVLALSVALFSVRRIILVFLVGLGIGVVIAPSFPAIKEKFKIPYVVTAIIYLLLFVFVVGAGMIVFTNLVAYDLAPLLEGLPDKIQKAFRWFSHQINSLPLLETQLRDFEFDFRELIPQATHGILLGLRSSGIAVIYGLFIIAVAIYFAIDSERYRQGFLALIPAYLRPKTSILMQEVGKTLRHWFVAQAIVMVGVAVMTAGALLIIGMRDWLAYGVLAGILNIVPYVGPFLTAGILIIVALGTDPSMTFWVLIAFVLIQQIESYLLVPIVMSGTISLPPIYLLFLIFVMGTWFGLLGIFAAPAIMAVSRQILLLTYIPKMNSMRQASKERL